MVNIIKKYEAKYKEDVLYFLKHTKNLRKVIDKAVSKDKTILIHRKKFIKAVDNMITYLAIQQHVKINNRLKYLYLITRLNIKANKIIKLSRI